MEVYRKIKEIFMSSTVIKLKNVNKSFDVYLDKAYTIKEKKEKF